MVEIIIESLEIPSSGALLLGLMVSIITTFSAMAKANISGWYTGTVVIVGLVIALVLAFSSPSRAKTR